MIITISVDKKVVNQARRYAEKQNTSLSNLIRTYLQTIGSENNRASRTEEFCRLAKQFSGRSPEGFIFERESI